MFFGGHGHEAVRRKGFWIDAGGKFPLLPAIVMFCGGKAEGTERFGTCEFVVAPLLGKKSGQKRVVRLADDDDGVGLLKDQRSTLCTGAAPDGSYYLWWEDIFPAQPGVRK